MFSLSELMPQLKRTRKKKRCYLIQLVRYSLFSFQRLRCAFRTAVKFSKAFFFPYHHTVCIYLVRASSQPTVLHNREKQGSRRIIQLGARP